MKNTIGYALIVVATMTSASFADSGSTLTGSDIDRVLRGHGSSGDAAQSTSNPDISYRVLETGAVEKANRHYQTIEIQRPSRPSGSSLRPGWVGR